jgi:hypothetical protein
MARGIINPPFYCDAALDANMNDSGGDRPRRCKPDRSMAANVEFVGLRWHGRRNHLFGRDHFQPHTAPKTIFPQRCKLP